MKSFDSDECVAAAESLQWFIISFHFSSFLAILIFCSHGSILSIHTVNGTLQNSLKKMIS